MEVSEKKVSNDNDASSRVVREVIVKRLRYTDDGIKDICFGLIVRMSSRSSVFGHIVPYHVRGGITSCPMITILNLVSYFIFHHVRP